MRRTSIVTGLVIAVAGLAGAAQQALSPDCGPAGDVRFVCGQQAPEDLVVVPGGRWVVASAYGGTGGIYLIRVADRTSALVYPVDGARERWDRKTYGACPGPPDAAAKAKFQTHGLSIQPGAAGVHRLLVVLHGARESVEMYELDARGSTPVLTWVGCVVAPDPIGLNSVRWLPDGGFIATNFLPRGQRMQDMMNGTRNGELWEWHAESGWQKVPGSEASGANGLELSDNGRTLYVAAWGSQSFFRLSRGGASPSRDEVALGFRVDNIRWAGDGSILAAGQAGAQASQETVVVKIDPETLAVREVLRRPNLERFGAGTVAVEIGDALWVGSFRGDRIAIYPLR